MAKGICVIVNILGVNMFTIEDKHMWMTIAIVIICFNLVIFTKLESLNKNKKKFQIKSHKIIYVSIIIILVVSSFVHVLLPWVDKKTMEHEIVLVELLVDNEIDIIEMKTIGNVYYPEVIDNNLIWYTEEFLTDDFRDPRYKQSEEINNTYIYNNMLIYEINNDSKILSVVKIKSPIEFRGTEVQSFFYSLSIVLYNTFMAILIYPLFSSFRNNIKILWKSQNIFSIILSSFMLESVFMF